MDGWRRLEFGIWNLEFGIWGSLRNFGVLEFWNFGVLEFEEIEIWDLRSFGSFGSLEFWEFGSLRNLCFLLRGYWEVLVEVVEFGYTFIILEFEEFGI